MAMGRKRMQNVIRNLFALLIVFSSLSLAIKPAYSQTDTSGAEALGRAIGTLLGNVFSNSKNSGQSQGSQDSSNLGSATTLDTPSQESMSNWQAREKEIIEYIKILCSRDDLKPYFEKSTCKVSDLTMGYLVDESKITPAQKKSFILIDEEYKKVAEMQSENDLLNIKPSSLGKQIAESRIKFRLEGQKSLQELYLGKINWGQYNTKRKEISHLRRDEFIRLSKQAGY